MPFATELCGSLVLFLLAVLVAVDFLQSPSKKRKQPYSAIFVWGNLVVAVAVILLLVSLPKDWDLSNAELLIALASAYAAFLAISAAGKKSVLEGLLWAVIWVFGTAVTGAIASLFVHGIGPCL